MNKRETIAVNKILDERDQARAEVERLRQALNDENPMIVDTRELRAVRNAIERIELAAAPSSPEGS